MLALPWLIVNSIYDQHHAPRAAHPALQCEIIVDSQVSYAGYY
jgi:hypothetical protein